MVIAKRLLAISIILVVIFNFAGCGNSASKEATTTGQNEVSTKTTSGSNTSSSSSTVTGDKQQNDNKAQKTEQSGSTKEVAKKPSVGNTFSNLLNGGKFVEANDSDYIYYNVQGKFYRAKKDGSEETFLIEKDYTNLNYLDGFLYSGNVGIGRIDANNPSNATGIASGSNFHIQAIFATKDWIYYKNNGSIYRMKSDGTGNERLKLNATPYIGTPIFVIDNYLYFITDAKQTARIDIDDNLKAEIIDVFVQDFSDKNMFSIKENKEINISNLDGTNSKTIYKVSDQDNKVSYINISDNWIYFIEYNSTNSNSFIYKMKVDGSNKQKVYEAKSIGSIQIAGDYIFFKSDFSTTFNAQDIRLQKIKKDGSGYTILEK